MIKKSALLTGFVGSLLALSNSATGSAAVAASCDEETREFILTSDNPLFSCPANAHLSDAQLQECKTIVQCMIEEGVIVDKNSLARFGNPGGSTSSGNGGKTK